MSHSMTKTNYCTAKQCLRRLWLQRYGDEKPAATPSDSAEEGIRVGLLAREHFGAQAVIPHSTRREMAQATEQLLNDGVSVIAEASFLLDGLFCSVDLLTSLGNNEVVIREVKSSTGVKDTHLDDAAFQYHVLTALGYRVRRVSIVHINSGYVRRGKLDLNALFIEEDVTAETADRAQLIPAELVLFNAELNQPQEPLRDIGEHCFAPLACEFFSHCTRDLPQRNVFGLHSMKTNTKLKLYREGIISFEEVRGYSKLSSGARLQIEHTLQTQPPLIHADAIREFLSTLFYPLYFLDFESYQTAIPPFDGIRPYDQIPFQYSLHRIESEGSDLEHTEFLAEAGTDPRRPLAEQLCRDIPRNVCVTAYNMAFEKDRIEELADLYPDLREHLLAIHKNIRDLMIPFRSKDYYTRDMEGSYSIKYVLPALFPGDPALDYHNLDGVHKGTEAAAAFHRMASMTPEEQAYWRRSLLEYCKLDTFAMVKVWQKLLEAAKR